MAAVCLRGGSTVELRASERVKTGPGRKKKKLGGRFTALIGGTLGKRLYE